MRKLTIIAVALLLSPMMSASGQQPSADEASREYFTDLELLTQYGEPVRFYTDVLKDQVVVISFIFTNCMDACPLITEKMRAARELLGDELGSRLRLVSISIDPLNDTPEAMKEFAEQHRADGNWLFLTGVPENIEQIVKKLGQHSPDVSAHSTMLIAGNVKDRHWMKIPPMAGPEGVAASLRVLLEEAI
jgi:protein SCO1/2